METHIQKFLLAAESKALATVSPQGIINVIPVSTLKIRDNKIILMNYFMGKTQENITQNNYIALVAWSDMFGYQIKGPVDYITTGELYEEMKNWVNITFPERNLYGLLAINPKEIYDIAPDKKTKEYTNEHIS